MQIIETEVSYDQVFAMAKKLPLREQSILRDSLALMIGNAGKTSHFASEEEVDEKFDIYSYITPEDRERFQRNHDALVASLPKRTPEEWQEIFTRSDNFPVATEEEIKLHEEASEDLRKWR
ncbi:MAG: hypothetical protein LBU65_02765 [Planctomycetaceae bacterium]|jgi:hypothetical protein|nr:hypothetical protein [Planctomycetaceae bacterium]